MAVKIKLKRLGKMRDPHYRIVVADSRTKRDGRAIEEIGEYHPKSDPSRISVDSPRAQYWLGVGAQPTEAVAAILRVTGDWQAFRGEPAPDPMRMPAPKPDKRAAFEAAVKETAEEQSAPATTPRSRARKATPPPQQPQQPKQPKEAAPAEPTEPTEPSEPAAAPAEAAVAAPAEAEVEATDTTSGGADEPGRAADQPAEA
ncbi:MAG: 30S ribosomal protein S16 [Acidothermales bacterium]|nr:30S ribosomal protein S16 [Acidothermales bacterium]